jgi:hypothetical protein
LVVLVNTSLIVPLKGPTAGFEIPVCKALVQVIVPIDAEVGV